MLDEFCISNLTQNGPELLPREDMLRLCAKVIGTTGAGKVQQMAYDALMHIAKCASGNEGCTAAEQGEVDILLECLQAPGAIVREAGLEVKRRMGFVGVRPVGIRSICAFRA